MITQKEFHDFMIKEDYLEEEIPLLSESMKKRIKLSEIEKIIPLLKKEGIDVKNCLYVLARGKYKEIKTKIEILKKFNSLNELKNYSDLNYYVFITLSSNELEKIFILEKENRYPELTKVELKCLFLLKGYYNHFYTLKEIENLCIKMQIKVLDFLKIFKIDHQYITYYLFTRLKQEKTMWIGKKYGLTKEQLTLYGEFLLKICNKITNKFLKIYPNYKYLREDL